MVRLKGIGRIRLYCEVLMTNTRGFKYTISGLGIMDSYTRITLYPGNVYINQFNLLQDDLFSSGIRLHRPQEYFFFLPHL